jgi:hypothetical protein
MIIICDLCCLMMIGEKKADEKSQLKKGEEMEEGCLSAEEVLVLYGSSSNSSSS